MTRAELVRRMSGSELAYWIAFFNLEIRDREREAKRARGKAKAQQMVARMRAGTA